MYLKRSGEKYWNELSDLVSILPYPLAAPLALYLSQSDPIKLVKQALEFVEGALAMAAYVAYQEYCAVNKGRGESKLFKGFTQRSGGPLWDLLKKCLEQLKGNAVISAPYKELLTPELYEPIDKVITFLAKYKHGKASETLLDTLRPVQILANISQKVFTTNVFGFFEQVRKQRFDRENQGLFRLACGNPPFIKALGYRGPLLFSEEESFLLNLDNYTALSLQPLVFWDHCNKHPEVDIGHCYLFDKPEKTEGVFSFKAVGFPCTCEVSVTNQFSTLANTIVKYRERDPQIDLLAVGTVWDTSEN